MDEFSERVGYILQCLPQEMWDDIKSEAKSLIIKYNASVIFHKKLIEKNKEKSVMLWIYALWKIKERETQLLKSLHELILNEQTKYIDPYNESRDVDDKDDDEPNMYDYFPRK